MNNKTENYQKGYKILLEDGWTPDEIKELTDSMVESTYEAVAYSQGLIKITKDHCVINESGELLDIIEYEGYVHESFAG
jgi:hypothetical protein